MKQISIDGSNLSDVIQEAIYALQVNKLNPTKFLIQRIKRTNQYSFSIKAEQVQHENRTEINSFTKNLNKFVSKYFTPTVKAYYALPDVREVEINSMVSNYEIVKENSSRSVYFESSTADTNVLLKRLQINLNNISKIQALEPRLSSFNEFELVYSKESYRRMKFIDKFSRTLEPKIEYAINDLVVFLKSINKFKDLPSRPTFLLSMMFSLETGSMLHPISGKYTNYSDLEYIPNPVGFNSKTVEFLDTNLENVMQMVSGHLTSIDLKKKKAQRNQLNTQTKFRVQANFSMKYIETNKGLSDAVDCANSLLTDADLTCLDLVSIVLNSDMGNEVNKPTILNSSKFPSLHKSSTIIHIKDLNLVG